MLRGIGLTAALLAAVIIAWLGVRSPTPRGADAPADAFSAARAMSDVAVIAASPHPTGSAANQRVRDHLLLRMRALGLSPRVQSARAFEETPFGDGRWISGGAVETLIGVLPGRDPAKPAIAVVAHYDSVVASPGAADDGAGTASLLEIARALRAGPQPKRDVVFLVTDGEEVGLLGARAFFASHDPLLPHIGAVINMEARGGGGRAAMFQTGADNGAWIALLRRNAHQPISSSLAVFIYEHMPNDTDFTVTRGVGLPGLNFAFIGREFDYHSPTSTPAALDKGALQHIGEQVLAVTRAAALAPTLPGKATSAVYSQTFGDLIVAYPPWGGWVVLAIAAALLSLALWRSRRAGQLIWPDVGLGAGVAVYLLAWTAALLNLARRACGAGFGWLLHRRLLAAFGSYETAVVVLLIAAVLVTGVAAAKGRARTAMALAALLSGALASLFGGFDPVGLGLGVGGAVAALVFVEPIGRPGCWAGFLLSGLAAGIALQLAAPAAAFLIGWPLLVGALAAAVSQMGADGKLRSMIVRVVLAAIALGWLGVYLHGVMQGLDMAALLAVFAWIGALVAWPLFQPRDPDHAGLTGPVIALVIGVALIGLMRFHAPWSARHPRATEVVYVADLGENSYWRVSLTPMLDSWSRAALTGDGGPLVKRRLDPLAHHPLDAARATPVPVEAPQVNAGRLADGRVQVRMIPTAAGRDLFLQLTPAGAITDLRINGLAAQGPTRPGAPINLRWQGDPTGLNVTFRPTGLGGVRAIWLAVTPGWPASARALPVRPDTAMAWDLSDSTVVTGVERLSW
jgi:hypothetical protein